MSPLLIGWDIQNMTPEKPVELIGQYYQRLSQGVRDPLYVRALALEQQTPHACEQAIFVSFDMVFVTADFTQEIRDEIRNRIPELDPQKIIFHVTHTHSAPSWTAPFRWWKPAPQVLQPHEIRCLYKSRAIQAIETAWKNRESGFLSTARTYATTGFCRRTLHSDGHAEMYGDPTRTDFIGMEAGSDPAVQLLFTWDTQRRLTGVIVNVACPAQVLEAEYVISGDFFGELQKRLQSRHGPHLHILPQLSAAGDLSPRDLPTQRFQTTHFWKEEGLMEIARRLETAIDESLTQSQQKINETPSLKHTVTPLALPVRRASPEEYQQAQIEIQSLIKDFPSEDAASQELCSHFVDDVHRGEKIKLHGPYDDKSLAFVQLENAQAVVKRYQTQDKESTFPVELHIVRIGDAVFATNPFELYLDYGQTIQARSLYPHTFLIQLACDCGGYLPTARSIRAGGYGSLIINGKVGAEGGNQLVESTLKAIQEI